MNHRCESHQAQTRWRDELRSHSPVSVPLPVFLVRDGVQVRQRDDVAAVGAQPLLVESAFSVLQLSLVFVGDADVGVVVLHAHSGHSRVVALQELLVHPLVMLRKQTWIRL